MRTTELIVGALLTAGVLTAEVRIGMSEALKAVTQKVQPEISAVAKQMRVSGRVEVEATVGPDGAVEDVKVISGNALLTSSTVTAVRKWRFTPFQANGSPTTAVVTLTFEFKQ